MRWFFDLCVQQGGYWLPVFVLALMLCLTLVAMVAVAERGKFRRAKLQADLTQSMLQRGMSAADIHQALTSCRDFVSQPYQPAQIRRPAHHLPSVGIETSRSWWPTLHISKLSWHGPVRAAKNDGT